jgi:hypothetical protein
VTLNPVDAASTHPPRNNNRYPHHDDMSTLATHAVRLASDKEKNNEEVTGQRGYGRAPRAGVRVWEGDLVSERAAVGGSGDSSKRDAASTIESVRTGGGESVDIAARRLVRAVAVAHARWSRTVKHYASRGDLINPLPSSRSCNGSGSGDAGAAGSGSDADSGTSGDHGSCSDHDDGDENVGGKVKFVNARLHVAHAGANAFSLLHRSDDPRGATVWMVRLCLMFFLKCLLIKHAGRLPLHFTHHLLHHF